jgi:hypothetical protein
VRSAADNAAAEAFFSTLEHEVLSRHHFTTKAHARRVVVAWCQDFYNTRTQTQLSGIDVADPIRETRCRPTGRSLREAFTIPGEAQRSPKERHLDTPPASSNDTSPPISGASCSPTKPAPSECLQE